MKNLVFAWFHSNSDDRKKMKRLVRGIRTPHREFIPGLISTMCIQNFAYLFCVTLSSLRCLSPPREGGRLSSLLACRSRKVRREKPSREGREERRFTDTFISDTVSARPAKLMRGNVFIFFSKFQVNLSWFSLFFNCRQLFRTYNNLFICSNVMI